MKKFAILIAGLGIAAGTIPATAAIAVPAPAHAAQAWQNINARQARIENRINQGIRSGAISRREATRLRGEFRQIAALEARFRRGGLSIQERRTLDNRFDALERRIRNERNDRNDHRGGRH